MSPAAMAGQYSVVKRRSNAPKPTSLAEWANHPTETPAGTLPIGHFVQVASCPTAHAYAAARCGAVPLGSDPRHENSPIRQPVGCNLRRLRMRLPSGRWF